MIHTYPGRELPHTYLNMIYSKWLRSLRYGNDYFKLISAPEYYFAYQNYITTILDRSNTMVRLALLSDDYDVVLGFSVVRDNTLEYVHVHKHQRKLGIGTKLIPQGIDSFTHITKTWLSIWNNKFKHWKFNPFA